LKSELTLWRRIIWPDTKADWFASAIAVVLGSFTTFVTVAERVAHPGWLLVVCGVGIACVTRPCYRLVSQASIRLTHDGAENAQLENAVKCWPCSVFRFCLFSFLAVLLLMGAIKPSDPRKELTNLGTPWTVDAFFDAIRRGETSTVRLFLAGRMTTDAPDTQGRPLPVMLALNTNNAADMLDLLVGAGLDVNHSYEVAGALGSQHMTLLSRAIERGSTPLISALIKHHVDVNSPIQTFGAMGLTRDTYPLASAISWKRFEIAQMLFDAGADPATGDYAGYREARALRERSTGDAESSSQLDVLVERLKPHGSAAARIEGELRLQDIEQKLNQIALASLRTLPGSFERRRLDAQYDQLQTERGKLRADLHMAGK
jgi:hypothetical protein